MNIKKQLEEASWISDTRKPERGYTGIAMSLMSKPMPTRIGVWNGVAVRDQEFFNPNDVHPFHKEGLVEAVKEFSEPEDRVVFVGSGKGVSPIRAARDGKDVVVYEASKSMVDLMKETAEINEVDIEVVHALVESGGDVFGDLDGAGHIKTADMKGDVLVLDCEGAEAMILPAPQFDTVITETHPQFGAETQAMIDLTGAVRFKQTPHEGCWIVRQ